MNRRLLVCAGAFGGSMAACVPLSADVVTDWNAELLRAVRVTSTNPPRASRAMAMVQTAVFDAVNSVHRGYQPYLDLVDTPAGTSAEAAAAVAAHRVLSSLFPGQVGEFDLRLADSLGKIPDGPGKDAGIALGQSCAASLIAARANDGSNDVVPYVPGDQPGQWRPTPPGFLPALLPNWPGVTPFAMTSGSQFRPPAPPALNSAEYAAAYDEVKRLGRVDSAERTAEQTEIARIWAAGAGTVTPPGQWNQIASQLGSTNSLEENARMFALLGIAVADAAIVSWDAKYEYDLWRPVTGIQLGDVDGNDDTEGDAAWQPLLVTPPFPSYTSGHSTFSSASAAILEMFFGTDSLLFTVASDGLTRDFSSLSEAAAEAGQSRIYGGIHWQFDNVAGLNSGDALARYIFANFLRPIPSPGSVVVLGMGVVVMARRRRR